MFGLTTAWSRASIQQNQILKTLGLSLVALTMSVSHLQATEGDNSRVEELSSLLKADEEDTIDNLVLTFDEFSKYKKQKQLDALRKLKNSSRGGMSSVQDGNPDGVVTPGIDPNFPDPTDPNNGGGFPPDGTWDDSMFPFPGLQGKAGLSDRLAMVALYETLNFYGVEHYLQKVNSRLDFKIVKSKNGYFTALTKLDIAFAVREFARYITAVLCNDPSYQNFYKAFGQVPAEEIGLRFKYDMAIALMGNSLPKEANQVVRLGSRWSSFQQILNTTSSIRPDSDPSKDKDYRSWLGMLSDIVNVMVRMNKLMCYVDIRPNPKEELKKRTVVQNFLNLEKTLNEKYMPYKEIIDQSKKDGQQQQINSFR